MRWGNSISVTRVSVLLLVSSSLLLAGIPTGKRTPLHPNVILITIDTVRADHLGCYGSKNIQTPTLDSLAHDGIVFERAISQVPLTWPSHAAMLTGTYPFQNGVQDFTGHPLSPDFRSIAETFKSAGYATGAVVSSFVLDRSWGLARGFDLYDDAFSPAAFREKDLGLVERRATDSVSHALDWLNRTPKRPFFLWLHLYDPHSPYDPPEPYRTDYQNHPYDGEITYADHELGRLISWLKQKQIYQSSVIVVVSDHGESLGEHGESEHGFFIYNATVHIPLIVKPPAESRVPRGRVDTPSETIAIAPTLLRLAGLHDQIEKQFQTGSLFAQADGVQNAYSETFYPFSSFGWSPLHSIESSRYHYIDAPQPELYDLVTDPEEKRNLASEQPATVAVMKEELKQRLGRGRIQDREHSAGNLNPDTAEKLRALGYVAYQSPIPVEMLAKGLANPKDKLWEFNSFLRAQDAFRAGQFQKADELLDELEQRDPNMYIVPFIRGEGALRQEKWADAVAHMKRCLDLNRSFGEAMTGLAHALYAQGNASEARVWLENAVAANPENYRAWYELGTVQLRTDPPGALVAYGKAVSIQPNFARGQRDLGILEVAQKQYSSASEHLQRALELGLDDAQLLNFLGIAYTQTKQFGKAIQTLRGALKQDPNLAEAHVNLGFAYEMLHRRKAADAEYKQACRLKNKFCGVRTKD